MQYNEPLPSFDELCELAQQSPAALERLRQRFARHAISSAHPATQRRLRGLQFRIEARLQQSKNPIASCVLLSGMMRESIDELQLALRGAHDRQTAQQSATILAFPLKLHP